MRRERFRSLLLAVGLLLVLYAQMMGSVRVKSATYDEQTYFARGYAVLKTGDMRLRLRHPLLTNIISAAPLLLMPDLELPTEHRSWQQAEFHEFSAVFLWEANVDRADRIVYLARWPMMLLAVLLAAFVCRWAGRLFGRGGALLALGVVAFDPNLIAHARLANTDFGATAFIFIAAYAFWEALERPTWWRVVAAGIACGLAQTTRFTALLILPVFGLEALIRAWRQRRRWRGLRQAVGILAAVGLLSLLTIWGVYGFSWGPVDGSGPRLPAPDHWGEFVSLTHRLDRADPAFLLGRIYAGGWWPYYLVAFLVKTPLPTLALIAWALVLLVRRFDPLRDGALLLPVGAYMGSALVGNLNTGYRMILPILPFLAVHAGRIARLGLEPRHRWRSARRVSLVLVLLLAAASLRIYPHYLAYFNLLVGPRNGYRVLVDSNLDWGQDLPGLRRWMADHDVEEVYLSWFGIAPPEQYGVRHQKLPGWPPFEDPALRVYHPRRPLPGVYAISATHLQGVLLDDPRTFVWFQGRDPLAQVGYSIFTYRVPPTGPPVDLALGNVRLDELPADLLDVYLGSNDLRLRWFDPSASLIVPSAQQEHVYYAFGTGQELAPPLAERFAGDLERLAMAPAQTLWSASYPGPPVQPPSEAESALIISPETVFAPGEALDLRQTLAAPVALGDEIEFLGYELLADAPEAGRSLDVLTYWRVLRPPDGERVFFVHLLDDQSQIWGQRDDVAVPVQGWHAGDLIVRLHRLPVAADAPAGRYWLEAGLYDPRSMARLTVAGFEQQAGGDRLLLAPVRVH